MIRFVYSVYSVHIHFAYSRYCVYAFHNTIYTVSLTVLFPSHNNRVPGTSSKLKALRCRDFEHWDEAEQAP